jgi:DNA-binding transcriptional LysR family regulator
VRFDQLDVVQRRVGEIELGLYAAPVYLERFGHPDANDGFTGHALVALHEAASHVPDLRWLAEVAPSARFALRSNSTDALARATEAGAGLALLPRFVAAGSARLVRVPCAKPVPTRPLYLGVHRDMQKVARVRTFIDWLTSAIARLQLGPHGRP